MFVRRAPESIRCEADVGWWEAGREELGWRCHPAGVRVHRKEGEWIQYEFHAINSSNINDS